VELGAVNADSI